MYDVIVIGAGNGGLAAAATAASKGLKTLLLEQHNLPGGFASSFVRGRFEFEPSLHELCDVGTADDPGGVGALFKRLGLDIGFAPVPEAYRLITTDDPEGNLDISMPFGLENYIEAVEKHVPGSADSVRRFIDLAKEVIDGLVYLGASKGNPERSVLMKEYPNLLKTAAYSVEQVEQALKIPEKARRILNAYWCYVGLPINKLNFTIFSAMVYKYLDKGASIPLMRSHEISSAFIRRFQELGGEVRFNTRVEKINTVNGKVDSVSTAAEQFRTRHVIANIPRHVVFGSMLTPREAVPEEEIRAGNARRSGAQGWVLYLGLNKSPDELGINEYSCFIYPSMDTEKMYSDLKHIRKDPIQAVVCLNRAIPDCSPPGTTIMSFTTLYTDDAWTDVDPEHYFEKKNEIAANVIDCFEKATGVVIHDSIEEISVASPATFARYTGANNGSIYGYEAESWDSLLPRLMMMEEDHRIPGLRFCGGFAFRLFGYSSAYLSGETAALLTLKDSMGESGNE